MVTADRHQVFTVHNFSVFSRKFTVFLNGRILGQGISVAVFFLFI